MVCSLLEEIFDFFLLRLFLPANEHNKVGVRVCRCSVRSYSSYIPNFCFRTLKVFVHTQVIFQTFVSEP